MNGWTPHEGRTCARVHVAPASAAHWTGHVTDPVERVHRSRVRTRRALRHVPWTCQLLETRPAGVGAALPEAAAHSSTHTPGHPMSCWIPHESRHTAQPRSVASRRTVPEQPRRMSWMALRYRRDAMAPRSAAADVCRACYGRNVCTASLRTGWRAGVPRKRCVFVPAASESRLKPSKRHRSSERHAGGWATGGPRWRNLLHGRRHASGAGRVLRAAAQRGGGSLCGARRSSAGPLGTRRLRTPDVDG